MINGKTVYVIAVITLQQRCYLCELTSKDFNVISKCLLAKVNNKKLLELGISPLHAIIRLFECLLHLSYKLKICKWQARTKEEKEIVENEKKNIQEKFRTMMGLIVDKPKPGYGSSNDGNTARKFFHNFEESAEITGINKNLIYRFHVILLALSSTFTINSFKFKNYCLKTAVLFVKNYPWYPMPITLHKIVFHGFEILENAMMPLGLLSEETQESRNKDIKAYRERYSRKFLRVQTLEDMFHNLLVSSDPYIVGISKIGQKKYSIATEYPKE